jgi:hypothetical protein
VSGGRNIYRGGTFAMNLLVIVFGLVLRLWILRRTTDG